ncbi:MAG: hypothetical protein IPH76_10660 [Xanthomonadales bacterium]|nr:hypothetical protein [Xanthomonadales bacterium]
MNELRAQRAALSEQAAAAAQRADQLRGELTALQHAHAEERRTLQAHVEHVENRCAETVDRAREENKALAARIKQLERERGDALLHWERFKEESIQARIALERAATRELARADLLDAQLKRLVVPQRDAKSRSAQASATEARASKTASPRPATPPRRPRRAASTP